MEKVKASPNCICLGSCGGPRPFLGQTESCCHTVGVKKYVKSHLNHILLSAFSLAASLLNIYPSKNAVIAKLQCSIDEFVIFYGATSS